MVLCCFVNKLYVVDSSAVTLLVLGAYSPRKEGGCNNSSRTTRGMSPPYLTVYPKYSNFQVLWAYAISLLYH